VSAARATMSRRAEAGTCEHPKGTAGPSTSLRSGRDDNCCYARKSFGGESSLNRELVIPTGA
jgi:hypothetical protein